MVMIFHSYVNVYQRVYQPILVGAIATPLKNMTSSVGMIIPFPTEWKVIKFSWFHKPPTRYDLVSPRELVHPNVGQTDSLGAMCL